MGTETTIQSYPRSSLPSHPAARFQALFDTRASWLLEELQPFIEDLAVEGKRREALLLRYARAKRVVLPAETGKGAAGKKGKGGKEGEGGREVVLYSARVRY